MILGKIKGVKLKVSGTLFFRHFPNPYFPITFFKLTSAEGGFCLCEADSAEALYEASAPWAGVYLDYEITPIIAMEKAAELSMKASAFRKG